MVRHNPKKSRTIRAEIWASHMKIDSIVDKQGRNGYQIKICLVIRIRWTKFPGFCIWFGFDITWYISRCDSNTMLLRTWYWFGFHFLFVGFGWFIIQFLSWFENQKSRILIRGLFVSYRITKSYHSREMWFVDHWFFNKSNTIKS